ALLQSRPWRDELTLATRMCRDAPRSALAHSSLGLATYRLARWPDAAREFATAARLEPADPWSFYYLGASLRRAGSIEPAERGLADAHFNLGGALFARQRLAEAESALRAGLALEPGAADERLALGRVLLAQGRREEAAREVEQALRSAPADSALRRAAAPVLK